MFERVLFRSGELGVGHFRCPPGAPAWTRQNHTGPWHLIVSPRTAVMIEQADREPVVANPNHAVFYNPFQPYRREAMSARGDDCVSFIGPDQLSANRTQRIEPRFSAAGDQVAPASDDL